MPSRKLVAVLGCVAVLVLPAAASAIPAGIFPAPLTSTFGPFGSGDDPDSADLGDLDGINGLDLVSSNEGDDEITASLNDGTGQVFTGPLTTGGFDSPQDVKLADLDGDGNLDAVVADPGGSDNVGVALGNGDGTFDPPTFTSVCDEPQGLDVADFDEDGDVDVVVSCDGNNPNLTVLFGNGSGGFGDTDNYNSAGGPAVDVVVADFNRDGNDDFASVNSGTLNIVVRLGDGRGHFGGPLATDIADDVFLPNGPRELTSGDFDADGKADVAVTLASNFAVLLGRGDGTFGTGVVHPDGDSLVQSVRSIDAVDFDNDGDDDLLLGRQGNNISHTVTLSDGGGFPDPQTFSIGGIDDGDAVVAGDLNGDGFSDFAVTSADADLFHSRLNVPGTADVSVSVADSPDPVTVDTDLTITGLIANNAGGDPAPGAGFRYVLPAGVTFRSLSADAQFDCDTPAIGQGGVVECLTDTEIAFLNSTAFSIVVRPSTCGALPNTVKAVNDQALDPDLSNNSASVSTEVVGCPESSGGVTALPADSECKGKVATILGTTADDVIKGTAGDDVIVTGPGDDVVRGKSGDDIVCTGAGEDKFYGNAGDDRANGGSGKDKLRGNSGQDRLTGGSGNDKLRGGGSQDRLRGGPGTDRAHGGRDSDRCSAEKERSCEE